VKLGSKKRGLIPTARPYQPVEGTFCYFAEEEIEHGEGRGENDTVSGEGKDKGLRTQISLSNQYRKKQLGDEEDAKRS